MHIHTIRYIIYAERHAVRRPCRYLYMMNPLGWLRLGWLKIP